MSFFRRLVQCIFLWGPPTPKGNPKDAELIVTQAMPDCQGGLSSKTNLALADLAQKYHEELGIPTFPQAEVGRILKEHGVLLVGDTKFYGDISILSDEYIKFGSHGIACLQKEFCDSRGMTKVLVVAPYPHTWRAIWIYEKLGLEVIVPQGLPRMQFQANLSQWRWRRPITAYPYEFLTRLYFLYKGLI